MNLESFRSPDWRVSYAEIAAAARAYLSLHTEAVFSTTELATALTNGLPAPDYKRACKALAACAKHELLGWWIEGQVFSLFGRRCVKKVWRKPLGS